MSKDIDTSLVAKVLNVTGDKIEQSQQSIFERAKMLYNTAKDKLTDEEKRTIEWLDSEILECAAIGYNNIKRKVVLTKHHLLYAKRIASYYENQGFNVELQQNLSDEYRISIGWGNDGEEDIS